MQVDDQVSPEQTPELLLRNGGREVSSCGTSPSALCTMALEAPVGQEGRGEADQRPVGHGGPGRAMLVMAKPQELLRVLYPVRNGPAFVVRSDDLWSGTRRGVGH